MHRILFCVLCLHMLVSSPFSALAQEEGGGGIVYGSEIGALVSAPEGWIFDSKNGISQGLHAVMYPKGSTWSNSPAMMYVNIVVSIDNSLEDFIAGDIEKFKKGAPKIAVEKGDPISIGGGLSAEVRLFSGDQWGNYECVAYAAKGKSVALYVLSSRKKEDFDKSLSAFRSMVAKSSLMNVTINK
jgi:hypothetical protein